MDRNKYIIGKSFRSYLAAIILTLIIGQVCTTSDGILMSHFVSTDALSAINLMSPFNMIMAAVHALFAIGAGMLVGKAFGAQDFTLARRIFSVSIYSGVIGIAAFTIICLAFLPQIEDGLCPNERIQPFFHDYLQMYLFFVPVSLTSQFIKLFVSVAGAPSLVTKCAIGEGILNVILDVLFVPVMGMSIGGSALASGIASSCTLVILILYSCIGKSHLTLTLKIPHGGKLLLDNVKEGMPTLFGNIALVIVALAMNYLVINSQGADGVFIMSICMQTMSLAMLALNGCGSTVFDVGSVLVGEKDMDGLRILFVRALQYTCGFCGVITLIVLVWPDGLSGLYGAKTPQLLNMCRMPMREFSIMLLPLAITMLSKYVYQLMGYKLMSSIISSISFIFLLPVLALLAWLYPSQIWLSYPIVGVAGLAVQLIWVFCITRKKKNLHWLTLIPKKVEDVAIMSLSLPYSEEAITTSWECMKKFVATAGIDAKTVGRIRLVVEESVKNIAGYNGKKSGSSDTFDLHVVRESTQDGGCSVKMIVKDDGVAFDPLSFQTRTLTPEEMFAEDASKFHFGIQLAKSAATSINYKRMYGLNVLYVNF